MSDFFLPQYIVKEQCILPIWYLCMKEITVVFNKSAPLYAVLLIKHAFFDK